MERKREEARGLREELRSSWAHYEALGDQSELTEAARRALEGKLMAGEEVVVVIVGMSSSMVVGTDRRLFLVRNEFSSAGTRTPEISGWDHGEVSGIEVETGAMSGLVVVKLAGDEARAVAASPSSDSNPSRAANVLPLNRANFDGARRGLPLLEDLIRRSRR